MDEVFIHCIQKNKNIKLKELHTFRVCQNMINLSNSINLNENLAFLAEITGLFHDVGRFPQFSKYKTFSDSKSVNHAELSIDTLLKYNVLDSMETAEKEIIIKAIKYHNYMELPQDESEDIILISKMIRDADKLDIFNIVTEYAQTGNKDNPALEFSDSSNYSPFLVEAVLNDKKINYKDVFTNFDRKLLELSWVSDLNFRYSFEAFKKCQYLEKLISFLPNDNIIGKVYEHIKKLINENLNN